MYQTSFKLLNYNPEQRSRIFKEIRKYSTLNKAKFTISDVQPKLNKHAQKQNHINHSEKKNHPLGADLEIAVNKISREERE